MSLVELTEMIVKSLVKDEDSVSVKEFNTEENEISIEIVRRCFLEFFVSRKAC